MRVVVVTSPGTAYHKQLCASIAKKHNVVGVLHPVLPSAGRRYLNLANHRVNIRRFGLFFHLLRKLGGKINLFGWDIVRDVAAAEARYFPDAEREYSETVAAKAYRVTDINGPEGIELICSLKPDIVINSSGPIYREPFIKAANLMLNFHSGISPFYNGSRSIYWTFVNGQPHVTGGTLMLMNASVDAGDMLSHYLPSVEPDDTPGVQFMKVIQGGIDLYSRFLADLDAGRRYVAVPQGKPFRLTWSSEWTVYQNLMLERHIRGRICEKFVRPEVICTYWDKPDADAARQAAERFLLRIVYDA